LHFAFFILQFVLFIEVQSSLPHPDGYVGAHFSAQGTSGTALLILPAGEEEPQTIHFLSEANQLLRAYDCAKPAAFASLAIDFYPGHAEISLGKG
jgi:hypothetical protein